MSTKFVSNSFHEYIITSDLPVLACFWDDSNDSCKKMLPVMNNIFRTYKKRISFTKVDIQKKMQITQYYQVTEAPTYLLFYKGEVSIRLSGVLTEAFLKNEIERYLGLKVNISDVETQRPANQFLNNSYSYTDQQNGKNSALRDEPAGQLVALHEYERLRNEIQTLRKDLDHSYYRVPKQEFENVTVRNIAQDVTEQINRRFSSLRNWVGFILLVLSVIGVTTLSEFLNSKIENKMASGLENMRKTIKEDLEKGIEARLSGIREGQETFKAHTKERLDNNSKMVDERVANAVAEVESIKENAEVTTLKFEFRILEKDVDEAGSISREKGIEQLNRIIEKAEEAKLDNFLVSKMIDKLILWNFQEYNWKDLHEIGSKYEKKYDFLSTSWANIAIADMFLYGDSPSPVLRRRAIEACQKSLEAKPDYGIPHAVRLIIHMIDYGREKDTHELREASKLIRLINSGKSTATYAFSVLSQVLGRGPGFW